MKLVFGLLLTSLLYAEEGSRCGKIVFDPNAKIISWTVEYGKWNGRDVHTFKPRKRVQHKISLYEPVVERKGELSLPLTKRELGELAESMAVMTRYFYDIERDFQARKDDTHIDYALRGLVQEIEKQRKASEDERSERF